ncbi:cobalamin-binding protein, partial [Ideonella sp.]|uniref:cobalamin-binding protein n=1 Tax=Ideonella sp. TaxID=1929293 RepID=UPI003BB7A5A1
MPQGWTVLRMGLLAAWLGAASWAQAAISVQDDEGKAVTLAAPARRIISLAPHTTELLFAAGAGPQVIATVRYADYPAAAKALPQVGDAHGLDLEQIAALKPDLLVVWMHGSSAQQIERLRALKLPIFFSEPRQLPAISDSLRRLGALAGTDAQARQAADAFDAERLRLQARYSQRAPLRVFYQVWNQPLLSLNRQHLIHDVITLCGGVNVFAAESALVPVLSAESVLAARPQVLVTSSVDGRPDDSLAMWRPFKAFEPVARGQMLWLHADLISRQSPRILQGAGAL